MHEDKIYHIGGNGADSWSMPFEEWKYNEEFDNFTITVSDTELYDYYSYPETFVVNAIDYKNCV